MVAVLFILKADRLEAYPTCLAANTAMIKQGSVMVVSLGTCLVCDLGLDKRSSGGSVNRPDCKPW
jgi:hypothetical protein